MWKKIDFLNFIFFNFYLQKKKMTQPSTRFQTCPPGYIEQLYQDHHHDPAIIHKKKFFVCHHKDCHNTNVYYAYGGLFCKNHRLVISQIRSLIYRYQLQDAKIPVLLTIIRHREEEVNCRKIPEIGHLIFLENLKRKVTDD